MRDFNTSAGEQTVVATVPYRLRSDVNTSREERDTYSGEASGKVTHDVIFKVGRLKELSLEEVIPK